MKLSKLINTFVSVDVKARGSGKQKRNSVKALALKGFGLDQIWAQIEHHTTSVNDKLITQLTALMSDEDFLRNAMASTDDEQDSISDEAGDSQGDEGLDADYGSENEDGEEEQEDGYEFEKEGGKTSKKGKKSGLDLEGEKDEGGIFDKEAGDSDVEEYLEGLENE